MPLSAASVRLAGMTDVERYSAFSDQPGGGNPAGVVLDATRLDAGAMQAIATEVGYSETAFLVRRDGPAAFAVRYFSPVAEVPFCGHATVATGVALARRDGPGLVTLETQAGTVPVRTDVDARGRITATLTSVAPRVEATAPELVERALTALGWAPGELDASLPPRVAFAGARHLVLAAASRERLARLDYEFDTLRELMLEHDLTTLQLVWREAPLVFHARDPFPAGRGRGPGDGRGGRRVRRAPCASSGSSHHPPASRSTRATTSAGRVSCSSMLTPSGRRSRSRARQCRSRPDPGCAAAVLPDLAAAGRAADPSGNCVRSSCGAISLAPPRRARGRRARAGCARPARRARRASARRRRGRRGRSGPGPRPGTWRRRAARG